MNKATDTRFQSDRIRERVELNLFCFPYAGGTAQVFKQWADFLPSGIQVRPVELPGRGARGQESPLVSLPALVADLEQMIRPLLDKPFAFFGHSMGALIAYELARSLRRQHGRVPQSLQIAGRRAPQLPDRDPLTYNLPPDGFVDELIKLGGTPKEVIEHPELMEIVIPLLRADFQLVQTYEYVAEDPLRCPITVYGGLQDYQVPREKLWPWRDLTISKFALHLLPGDHFFIRSSQKLLLGLLVKELQEVVAHSRLYDGS